QIELATRREHLVAQEGANARREAEEKAAAGLIQTRGSAEQLGITSAAEANRLRQLGEARAAQEAAAMAVYRDMEQSTLLALALREAAGKLPNIGNLTITPDLLSGALAGLLRAPGGALTAGDGGTAGAAGEAGAVRGTRAAGAGGAPASGAGK